MSSSHAQQLQQDLETLRTVVGTELPFDRTDAKHFVAIGLAALLPAVAGLAGVKSGVMLLPFLVVLTACLIRGYRSTHPSKSCSRAKRREYRPGIWFVLALFPMIEGYNWWARSLDVPSGAIHGTVMMFLGVMIALGAINEPKRYAGWCVAIPAIIAGLLWPYLEYFQFWTLLWASVGFGMIASGLLMLRQLSGQEIQAASEGT